MEDTFQSRNQVRQTTSGRLQTPVSCQWYEGFVQHVVGQEGVRQKNGVQCDVNMYKRGWRWSALRTVMGPQRKRKRTTTRRRRPTKRRRRISQVGGVGPGLPLGILKAGYGITKAIGDHQTKRAIAIADKRTREWESGKRKRYAGESFNCSIM